MEARYPLEQSREHASTSKCVSKAGTEELNVMVRKTSKGTDGKGQGLYIVQII